MAVTASGRSAVFASLFLFHLLAPPPAVAEARDPFDYAAFRPAGYTPRPTGAIRVDAVLVTGDRQVALIDGRRYRVGDVIHGQQIVAITLAHVATVIEGRHKIYRVGAP